MSDPSSRRDALRRELAELRLALHDAEDRVFDAERQRHGRESAGPDTTNAHVAGMLRDLARSLQDARRERAKARREADESAARAARLRALSDALRSLLARIGETSA